MPELFLGADPYAPYPIPNWRLLSENANPQPGYVVSSGVVTAGSGHVGITDYDGRWISAGSYTVNRKANFLEQFRVYGIGDYRPAGQRVCVP
jgi:hypothetical protein